MTKNIGAVILSAGTASRMGRQKLLLPLAGQPLLAHVLQTVAGLPWADCLAVIGEPADELAAVCCAQGIRAVYNPRREEGQATSIVLAEKELTSELAGIMFFLGDQPLVPVALLEAVAARFTQAADPKVIVVPSFQGQRYSPVLFGSYWRPALAALSGDTGGRQIMRAHPEQVIELPWSEVSAFYDADTWQEYQELLRLAETSTI